MNGTTKNGLQLPLVHLNGDSRQNLEGNFANPIHAINDAIRSLEEHSPHGRNYYPFGDNAYAKAAAEHAARIVKLESVRNELLEILEEIVNSR